MESFIDKLINIEKQRGYRRNWYYKNQEKVREYYQKNKEMFKQKTKLWRLKNQEKVREYRKNYKINPILSHKYYLNYKNKHSQTNLCKCGCGNLCYNLFVNGHSKRGVKLSEEAKKKHSEDIKRYFSDKNNREKHSIIRKRFMSNPVNKRKFLDDRRTPEFRKKMSIIMKGIKFTEERCKNISIATKKAMSNPLVLKKALKRREKSSLEIKFEGLIKRINLPFKFVGNGEIIIGGKNPDFINEKNKIAVEVYYKKHKERFKGNLNDWKNERKEIFNKNGWIIFFFDETEVNENNVLELKRFMEGD